MGKNESLAGAEAELDKDIVEAVSHLRDHAVKRKERNLGLMLDNADASNYRHIASQLRQEMEKSVEATMARFMETVRHDIGTAANNLYEKIEQFSKAEQEHIQSPETWREYEPKHEVIKENLHHLQVAQESPHSEQDIATASSKTVESFQQAGSFLQSEYERLVEREQKIQKEMDQIKHIIKQIQEQTRGVSSKNLQLLADGERFVADIDNLRAETRWQKPVVAAALWKEACEQVQQVYTSIRDFPDKIKTAVRDKAYDIADQAVQKVAGIINKGIEYLQAKKEKVLNLSPIDNEKKRQSTEKTQEEEKTVQQPFVPQAGKGGDSVGIVAKVIPVVADYAAEYVKKRISEEAGKRLEQIGNNKASKPDELAVSPKDKLQVHMATQKEQDKSKAIGM